ncbi:hypothetical protein RCL1_006520 [Eukaryota sp. TZLM3-RCL]
MSRWFIVVLIILFQFSLASHYAIPTFSFFFVEDYHWTALQTTSVWSAVQVAVGLAPLMSSVLLRFISNRFLTHISSILIFLGFFISSWNGGFSFPLVLLGQGVLVGTAIGLSYIVTLNVANSYFPERPGLATGICIGSYGSASLMYALIAEFFLRRTSPGFVFKLFSLISSIGVFVCGLFMNPIDIQSNEPIKNDCESPVISQDFSPVVPAFTTVAQEAPTPKLPSKLSFISSIFFWKLFFIVFSGVFAGLLCISALRIFPSVVMKRKGFNDEEIIRLTFIATGVLLNFGNGLGRLFMGVVVDFLGPFRVLYLAILLQGILVLVFAFFSHLSLILFLSALLIPTLYGAVYVALPVIVVKVFRKELFSVVFPCLFFASAVSGILGPSLFGLLFDKELYVLSFLMTSFLLFMTFFVAYDLQRVKDSVLPV